MRTHTHKHTCVHTHIHIKGRGKTAYSSAGEGVTTKHAMSGLLSSFVTMLWQNMPGRQTMQAVQINQGDKMCSSDKTSHNNILEHFRITKTFQLTPNLFWFDQKFSPNFNTFCLAKAWTFGNCTDHLSVTTHCPRKNYSVKSPERLEDLSHMLKWY